MKRWDARSPLDPSLGETMGESFQQISPRKRGNEPVRKYLFRTGKNQDGCVKQHRQRRPRQNRLPPSSGENPASSGMGRDHSTWFSKNNQTNSIPKGNSITGKV